MHDDETVLGQGLADDGEIEVPFLEHRAGFGLFRGLQHHQHPLLAFRQHHLVGGHVLFALRHVVEVEPDPEPALVAHLDRRTGEPGGAHVLDRDYGPGLHEFQRRFHEPFLGERVADLYCRALFFDRVVEFGARHRRAADPVAPGLGTEIDHRHADARGRRVEDRIRLGEPGGEGVDQAVAVIGGVEPHLAADVGHAETIAVAADAFDNPMDEPLGLGVVHFAEAQRVHRRNRPRPHGEDVAQDAAHAGRGPLVGLDVRRVVVALHLEHQRLAVADIDDAGVLARPADHLRPLGRQGAQPFLGGFVRAMLVPHRREDAELGEVRRPVQDPEDVGVFVGLDAVGGDQVFGDVRLCHGVPHLGRSLRPSGREGKGGGRGGQKFFHGRCRNRQSPRVLVP